MTTLNQVGFRSTEHMIHELQKVEDMDGQAILEQKTTKRSMLTDISVLVRTGAIDSDELFDCMEQCLNEYLDNENLPI